jgi:hypothetical protein
MTDEADESNRFRISNDRAFSVDLQAAVGTAVVDVASSTPAYEGTILATLTDSGDFEKGQIWTLDLNGFKLRQVAQIDDTSVADIAGRLNADIASRLDTFYTSSVDVDTLTITRKDGKPFLASVSLELLDETSISGGDITLSTDVDLPGAFSATHYADVVIELGGPTGALNKGDVWTLTLNDSLDPADEVDFFFTVGSISATPPWVLPPPSTPSPPVASRPPIRVAPLPLMER